jgi:aspartyl-tRNA(Asn)/glutamyl-tRNA(Gln) amidotransferase subunit A
LPDTESPSDILTWSGRFGARAASPVELTEHCIARIERLDPMLNAFCALDVEGAREAARLSEARWIQGRALGPLDGIPVTIKDLISAAGFPFQRGSRNAAIPADRTVDSPCVSRLRGAGAIILGKTTTSEFGHKAVCHSQACGITRNPWDLDRTTGGSSGGAAAAATAELGLLHIGTDAGGSIRMPAAFTGVFGLKPTTGVVPIYPASSFAHLAVHGPITRFARDARIAMQTIAQPDSRDWAAPPRLPFTWSETVAPSALKIGIPTLADGCAPQQETAAAVASAAAVLAELGASVRPVSLDLSEAPALFETIWTATAAALLSAPGMDPAHCEPTLLELADRGRSVTGAAYAAALVGCAALADRLRQLHETVDLLILPTMPLTAFAAGADHPWPVGSRGWPEWAPYCYPFNLTRAPAASLPCGLDARGLPIGVQIVGPPFADATVLAAAEALQDALPRLRSPTALKDM